jgi:hypothetical protein
MNLIQSIVSILIFILLPPIINAQNLFIKTKVLGSGFKYIERANALPAEVEKLSLLNEKTGNHLFPQNH